MNELAKIEEGQIVIAEDVIKQINKFQKQKLKMDIMQEQLKDQMRDLMEQVGATKFVSNDGTIVINYFPAKTSQRLDTTRLKNEKPEIYKEFTKDVTTKSFVKLTVK